MAPNQSVELASIAPARQQAYAFLSHAFAAPPSEETLSTLGDESFLCWAARLFSAGVLRSMRALAAAREDKPKFRQDANQEFMNLFRVPGAQYVTPYESVYRDSRDIAGRQTPGLLMGPSAIEVQKWYRLGAVEVREEAEFLPDHICMELSFLAHLCAKEHAFITSGDNEKTQRSREMQRDFLASHPVCWVDRLKGKIHEKSRHPYFRAVSDMTVEFCRRDLATLEGFLGPADRSSSATS